MTAPSRTGSITTITDSSTSNSQSVTVPADAELCIVAATYYDTPAGLTFSTLTLGGSALTEVATWSDTTAYGYTTIWQLATPSTGSQTLAWDWNTSLNEGAHIFVLFYKDVDTASPITGSGTGSISGSVVTSSSFSSSTNDKCLCIVYAYDADPDAGYGSGQTEIANSGRYNNCYGALGEKDGVSGSTTMAADTGTYMSLVACSIAGESSVSVSPSARTAVAASVAPTVVLGSVSVSPSAGTAVAAGADPSVLEGGNVQVAPAESTAVGATSGPTVVEGSLAIGPAARAAVAVSPGPTVALGSTTAAPAARAAVAVSSGPTVVLGSLTVGPAARTAVATSIDPTVIEGSLTISPAVCTAVAASAAPNVVEGGGGAPVSSIVDQFRRRRI